MVEQARRIALLILIFLVMVVAIFSLIHLITIVNLPNVDLSETVIFDDPYSDEVETPQDI